MAIAPNFAATPRFSAVSIATADTSRTAPFNVGTVFTAGANGSRIDEVTITAAGTSTNNVVRLFVYNGVETYYLLQEVLTTAIVAGASQDSFTVTLTFNSFVLPTGHSLAATTNASETYHVLAFGGDF
jgi:hypothetical protein